MAFQLAPVKEVVAQADGFLALSNDPWLDLKVDDLAAFAGRLVELRYRSSFWDDPVRPLLRCITQSGTIESLMPAPVQGSGIWIGRIPPHVQSLQVSPTNRLGVFSFEVESLRKRSWVSLVMRGLAQAPRPARSTILTRLLGWRPESDNNLAWCVGTTRLTSYSSWRAKRTRPLDLRGIDRPRSQWDVAEPIHLWVSASAGSAELDATCASMIAQAFPHWLLHVRSAMPIDLPNDPRILWEKNATAPNGALGFVGTLRPGDKLLPHALGCLHEAAQRHPQAQIFYGDEELEGSDGKLLPLFKPGWSWLLHRQNPFLGSGVFLRSSMIGLNAEELDEFLRCGKLAHHALADGAGVQAIHRILLRTRSAPLKQARPLEPAFRPEISVSIVIPTKNHVEHLRRAVHSIYRESRSVAPELIIVDNGSSEEDAQRFLTEISEDSHVKLIEQPGAFNFSAMCNAGAAAAQSDVLVFLNNDTEVLSPDWLDRLKAWALQPQIGAVGAKLTYPDGRLQHIGVLLGMGGTAGHFGSLAKPDAPGWASRSLAVHEVSAVTGACLAVEATKFRAVGGFDAEAFPIELNDIDLCLRLAERGWGSVVDPFVHLLHEESASRGGATFRRLNVYQDQRARFIERWRHVLRDDPYFHPALSLFNWQAALG